MSNRLRLRRMATTTASMIIGSGGLLAAATAADTSASAVAPPAVELTPEERCTASLDTWLRVTDRARTFIGDDGSIDVAGLAEAGADQVDDCADVELVRDGTACEPDAGPLIGDGFSFDAATCTGGSPCTGGNGGDAAADCVSPDCNGGNGGTGGWHSRGGDGGAAANDGRGGDGGNGGVSGPDGAGDTPT